MSDRSPDPTGYDPDDDEPPRHITWRLDRFTGMFSSLVVAKLMRNNDPVGLLYLNTEQEFKWLKARIDGMQTQPRDSSEFEKD